METEILLMQEKVQGREQAHSNPLSMVTMAICALFHSIYKLLSILTTAPCFEVKNARIHFYYFINLFYLTQ